MDDGGADGDLSLQSVFTQLRFVRFELLFSGLYSTVNVEFRYS